jgi:hypothetical protein
MSAGLTNPAREFLGNLQVTVVHGKTAVAHDMLQDVTELYFSVLPQLRRPMPNMKLHPTSLALALAAALGSFAALPAHAALVTTTPSVAFEFDGTDARVTDEEGGGATTRSNISLGSSSIQQFNSSTGVLMGATLNVSGTQTQTTHATSTDGRDNGNNNQRTSEGTGSSVVAVTAAGISNIFSPISQTDSCTGPRLEACTGTSTSQAVQRSWQGSTTSGLASYVGTGDVNVGHTATALTAHQTGNAFTGAESTTSTVTWAGSLSLTYEYLLHAAPSFGDNGLVVLDLDFGTVFQGKSVGPLDFSILNAAGERVGLDLDGAEGSGSLSQLYADLAGFSGTVGAGSGMDFRAYFNTKNLGSFTSRYTLSLSDADVGAANSRSTYSMTLNLKGKVVAQEPKVNDVPEPGMLALASVGLFGLVLTRRRARRA